MSGVQPSLPLNEVHSRLPPPETPLREGEFRLLDLQPSGDAADSDIVSSLQTYSISEAPPFKALSYTCGNPYRGYRWIDGHIGDGKVRFDENHERPVDKSLKVLCDGQPFPVTPNLHDALFHLRSEGLSGLIWVDAICIKQDDLTERASQVQLMGKIYLAAEEVLVWLGPSRQEFDDLLWAVFTLLPKLEDFLEQGGSPEDLGRLDRISNEKLGIGDPLPHLINAAIFIGSTRWFHRAWIIQETVLAKNIRLICGDTVFSWIDLAAWAWMIALIGWDRLIEGRLLPSHESDKVYLISQIVMLEQLRLKNEKPRKDAQSRYEANIESQLSQQLGGLSLISADEEKTKAVKAGFYAFGTQLALARRFKCLDHHDRIYSQLGFAELNFKNSISDYICPDYSSSVEVTFVSAVQHILQKSEDLDLLAWTGPQLYASSPSMPSWVPDYRLPIKTSPLMSMIPPHDHSYEEFNVLGHVVLEKPFEVTNTAIKCVGGSFDIIAEVHDFAYNEIDTGISILSLLQFALKLPRFVCGKRRFEILWRTLVVDRSSQFDSPLPPNFERVFIAFICVRLTSLWLLARDGTPFDETFEPFAEAFRQFDLLEAVEVPKLDADLAKNFLSWLGIVNKVEGHQKELVLQTISAVEADCALYEQAQASAITGRRLYITRRGLLGFGDQKCESGDHVFVLQNTTVPLLLRPAGSEATYRLIGDCFMLDFMTGKMMEKEWGVTKSLQDVNII